MKTIISDGKVYNYKDAMAAPDVYVEKMPHGYIAESLADEVQGWKPEIPVAIFADTGTGKNYFVENVLVEWAKFYNKKVLLFSNRTALGRQEKLRLAKVFGVEHKLAMLNERGIDAECEFGPMTVVSYQQLESWLNEHSPKMQMLEQEFMFVVADEIHYATSDSQFNPMTDISLNYISSHFKDAIRIYMTATPEEVFPLLVNQEGPGGMFWRKGLIWGEIKLHVYMFEHDFSRFQPRGFNEIDDIIPLLTVTTKNEKAVVFVENKDIGAAIIEACGKGAMLTAESKLDGGPNHEVYTEIVEKEKTEQELLLCTAVLENGVNLKDTSIKTVVLFTNEKSRYLQMLGRIRCDKEQKLDVLVFNVTLEAATKHLASLHRQCAALKLFYADPTVFSRHYITDDAPIANVKAAFGVLANGQAHVNSLRKFKLEYVDIPLWEKLVEELKENPYAVLEEKCSWLETEFNRKTMVPSGGHNRGLREMILFLEKYSSVDITKDEQEAFRKGFSESYRRIYGKRSEDKTEDQLYGLAVIKNCLKEMELPYKLSSERGTWILECDNRNIESNRKAEIV